VVEGFEVVEVLDERFEEKIDLKLEVVGRKLENTRVIKVKKLQSGS
jgi:hypothetical protein